MNPRFLLPLLWVACFPSPHNPGDKGGGDTSEAREDLPPSDSGQGGGDSADDTDSPEDDTGSSVEADVDEDGFTVEEGDCNDDDGAIHPEAEEVCEDGINSNCLPDCRDEGDLPVEGADQIIRFWNPDDGQWGGARSLGDVDGDGYAEVAVSGTGYDCWTEGELTAFAGPYVAGSGEEFYANADATWSPPEGLNICGVSASPSLVAMTVDVGSNEGLVLGQLLLWELGDAWEEAHSADTAMVMEATQATGGFGIGARFVDLDGEGLRDDLLVPDALVTNVGEGAGAVHGFTDEQLSAGLTLNDGTTWLGGEENAYFGQSADAADLDLDGYPDLVVAAPNGGAYSFGSFYIFSGVASSGELEGAGILDAESAYYLNDSRSWQTNFGRALRLGDFTGDGHPDVIASASDWREEETDAQAPGALFLFPGPFDSGAFGLDATDYLLCEGTELDDHLGWALDVGDLDGNGELDVASVWTNMGYPESGDRPAALAFYNPVGSTEDLRVLAPAGADWFAFSAAFAGDVDGNGADDLLIGGGSGVGAYLLFGGLE